MSLIGCFILFSACDLIEIPSSLLTATPTVVVPTPVNTPEPSQNELSSSTAEESTQRETNSTLTVWVLPEVEIESDTPAGNIFKQQLTSFDDAHEELDVLIEQKAIIGQGSMLDYFSAASSVAPGILPDLILIPHDQLSRFVAEGVASPIDGLISDDALIDLYTVGDELTIINGQRMGYPHSLSGLTHAAFSSAVYTDTLPSRLDQMLNSPLTVAFSAVGNEGAELLYQLYIDEGGQLYSDDGNLALESTPLLVGLRRIQALRNSGQLSDNLPELADHDAVWDDYRSGGSSLILTESSRFSTERQSSADLSFATFPGSIGGITPLVEGWVWVVTTQDPAQQALAVELLSWMANGPNMGDWTAASQRLPARASAFERWPQDEYTLFLSDEVGRATVKPKFLDGNVGSILQGALQSLFSSSNPNVQQIAENAVEAINGN